MLFLTVLCAFVVTTGANELSAKNNLRQQEERQLYPLCKLCVDGLPPRRSCGGITVGLQGGGQTSLSCGDWYRQGLLGKVNKQSCNILGAAERTNNSCGCNRFAPPAPCGGGWTVNGGNGNTVACFAGNNIVQVLGKGPTPMNELQLGDYVADSLDGTFSKVYSFAHIDDKTPAEYLQIQTKEMSDQPLEVSASHILFVCQKAVLASQVQIGDMIGANQEVVDIRRVQRSGFYNPLTYSGKIVVSGVVASNYVGLVSEFPASVQNAASHIATSPVRLVCGQFGLCPDETHDAFGISSRVSLPLRAAIYINSRTSGLTQIGSASIAFITVLPVLALAYCIEHLAMQFHLLMVVLAAIVLLGGCNKKLKRKVA